ncbi:MAG TPA: glycosyltransferase [Candidatus Baltobacteraceae bacterium]|nr:glycosyltransferase [Candidatus Baltobacteraceae bacterium]
MPRLRRRSGRRGRRGLIRVLFLSANVGSGHLSAANAVCAGLREIDPDVRTHVVDSYKYAALVVSRVVSDGYLQMVKTIPQMYRYIYDRAERATEVGPFRTWAHQFTAGNLRPLIERERPDVVVCTHAFPSGAMAEYKKLYDDAPPVVGIVTDFAIHAFWIHSNIEGYCVATDAMRDILISRGVEPQRIVVSGIPVDPRFARTAEPIESMRERLGLPRDRHIALIMGGGLGFGPLERILQSLDSVAAPIAAVVIAGRNSRVERRVLASAQSVAYPVRVLRFVENVYDYLHAADVFVTKPGGLSTAEGLAAEVPMVLCKPIPGQEERNVRVLTDWGAALRVRSLDELPGALTTALTDSGRRRRMVAAAQRYGRPDAARDAADLVARLAGARKEVVA